MRRLVALGLVLMALAWRLLAGYAGNPAPKTGIPTDGSWVRHSPSAVVIAPTQTWEETSIQEPNMLPDGSGGWWAWCKGGWASGGATGYYTSPDGVSWTHYASNPVLGRGGSGISDTVSQPDVHLFGTTYYQYVNDPADTTNTPYVYTSTDRIAWTGHGHYVTSGSITSWGNTTVWYEAGTYYMLQEGRIGAGVWQIYLLSATSPLGPFSFLNSGNPLTTLQPSVGYNYGGPMLATGAAVAGTYHLYFHAGSGATTNIYHATSTDKINWTITNGGSPIVVHSGVSPETDQVADPDVHLYNGTWYMWIDAVDNTAQTGRIELLTAPAT